MTVGDESAARGELHVPFGEWWEEDDRVCCHLCGQWYVRLGQHIRAKHELSPDQYRLRAGRRAQRPLCATSFSRRMAERLATGAGATEGWQQGTRKRVERARSGQLPAEGTAAHRDRPRSGERAAAARAAGQRTGRARAAAYRQRRTAAAAALGHKDLAAYYRKRYVEDRLTVEQVAKELGCHWSTVRADLKRLELGPLRERSAGARRTK